MAVKPGSAWPRCSATSLGVGPLVEEQGCAVAAGVVASEVRDTGSLERGDPHSSPPVLSARTPFPVGEDERARVRSTAGEVELHELARDRCEQLRLASASDFSEFSSLQTALSVVYLGVHERRLHRGLRSAGHAYLARACYCQEADVRGRMACAGPVENPLKSMRSAVPSVVCGPSVTCHTRTERGV
jgi:hypothetical protein